MRLRSSTLGYVLLLGFAAAVAPDLAAQESRPAPWSLPSVTIEAATRNHRFWDRSNLWLFAGVSTVRALDYHSTRRFRRRGVNEKLLTNDIVDNKPLLAAIEVGGTAASVGLAYWFHRTGHHKLERWISRVHIGVSGFGAIRNYRLNENRTKAFGF